MNDTITRETLRGRRVKALHVEGYERCIGQVITVTDVTSGNTSWTSGFAVKGAFKDPDHEGQTIDLWAVRWEFADDEEALSNDDIREMRARIASLEAQAASREATIARLQNTIHEAHRGFEIIGDRLNNEAENRSWCSEFDEIFDEVNDSLPGPFMMPKRRKRKQIWVGVNANVAVRRQVWVDEDCDDADDPDNWFEEESDDDCIGDDAARDWAHEEVNENGFDDVEFEAR